ncbi:hypothetical protein GO755_30630 [Spirosoma sp. HMF4905]|uniref:Uncharacterized protein n=1 Tax=Spirosoma arboris TaxID=2682092 RepID=A0A7K1SKT9_9BACT|nr:hypothetical protein [Spirosoma arboris]MVM34427.1 hypothetical protein [Spirosoma arboris]
MATQHTSTTEPSAAKVGETIEAIRTAAKALSAAIKQANQDGINVSLEKAPDDAPGLIQIIYSV